MNNNNNSDQQNSLNLMKRRWLQDHQKRLMSQPPYINILRSQTNTTASPAVVPPVHHKYFVNDDDEEGLNTAVGVMPAVTVVVEGRSICHRVSLQNHEGYGSLAKALRRMLVDYEDDEGGGGGEVELANAIPGHVIAYEDMENDLLLAGDLNWKDFTRVARRIRIIPMKGNSSKGKAFK